MTKLRVFVASPGDVVADRDSLSQVVNELNVILSNLVPERGLELELVRWETHVRPALGRTQGVINEQIGPYDIFVGIMWKRFGTPTGVAESGTEEEFKLAYDHWLKNGRPEVLMYFCEAPLKLSTSDEIDQYKRLHLFKEDLQKKGLVWSYGETSRFADVIRSHLVMVLGQRFAKRSGGETAHRVGRLALDAEASSVREQALAIATRYERTRASMDPGNERTRKMELVMSEMRTMAPLIYPLLDELANHETAGQRLLAIAILQHTPTNKYYTWLADRFLEDKPFVAYHAGVALLTAARGGDWYPDRLDDLREALHRARRNLGPDGDATDRQFVLSAAEKEIDRALELEAEALRKLRIWANSGHHRPDDVIPGGLFSSDSHGAIGGSSVEQTLMEKKGWIAFVDGAKDDLRITTEGLRAAGRAL